MHPSAQAAGGRRVTRWTRELIIQKIREWNDRYGEPPCSADWNPSLARWRAQEWRAERYREGVWPSTNAAKRPFDGSFDAAVRAAGLEPHRPGPRRRAPGEARPDVPQRAPVAPRDLAAAAVEADERARRAEARAAALERRLAAAERRAERAENQISDARHACAPRDRAGRPGPAGARAHARQRARAAVRCGRPGRGAGRGRRRPRARRRRPGRGGRCATRTRRAAAPATPTPARPTPTRAPARPSGWARWPARSWRAPARALPGRRPARPRSAPRWPTAGRASWRRWSAASSGSSPRPSSAALRGSGPTGPAVLAAALKRLAWRARHERPHGARGRARRGRLRRHPLAGPAVRPVLPAGPAVPPARPPPAGGLVAPTRIGRPRRAAPRRVWHRQRRRSRLRASRVLYEGGDRRMAQPVRVSMTVNGAQREHEVEPRLLLVHFLREELGLTGTHVGCDTSNCGACTVPPRRRGGQELHGARRPGRRRPRSRRSRGSARRATCIRSRRRSGRTTACSAATARRG